MANYLALFTGANGHQPSHPAIPTARRTLTTSQLTKPLLPSSQLSLYGLVAREYRLTLHLHCQERTGEHNTD